MSLEWHYEQALKRVGVASDITGHGFLAGCDDPTRRIYHVSSWLERRGDDSHKLAVLYDGMQCALPNFAREISRYRKHINPDGTITDKPAARQADHLMDNLGYIAAYGPEWHETSAAVINHSAAWKSFKEWEKEHGSQGLKDSIVLA